MKYLASFGLLQLVAATTGICIILTAGAISKTINIPESFPYEAFKEVYELAYKEGLKGCTTFRPNAVTGSILESGVGANAPHCCSLEREAD